MTTENCRKEESKAKGPGENPATLLNSAMVGEAAKEKSILPSRQDSHIPTIEGVLDECNVRKAIVAVKRNKGAPGIDGITTTEIDKVMREQWPWIRQAILEGKYNPSPIKRVLIPKPDGNGVRQLGIPTVMDRIIQQAVHQELVPIFDPTFSQYSYGFRPNRKAGDGVLQAQKYIHEGCEWVVDIDLEKFFDRVNHDMLMARVARKVKDKQLSRAAF